MTPIEKRLRLSLLQRELYDMADDSLTPEERKVVRYAANILNLLRQAERMPEEETNLTTKDGNVIHVSFTRQ